MWELDLLLVPFMENGFRDLEKADQDRFVSLLDCEDQDLFLWFMQREQPSNPEHVRIVNIVLEHIRRNR